MGGSYSQEDYDRVASHMFYNVVQDPCAVPDIGIDESLLKYSGIYSHTELQSFSNLQVDMVPDFIDRLGSGLAPLTAIPNAVGLGALVISMIMEIVIKSIPQRDDSYDIFRRVFGEEKASAVRDTMSEYVRRHRTYLSDNRRLSEELRRLEAQLSSHLTILRNSLLHDEQMSTRGFKIWVNGAYFHVQMLVHEARLNIQSGKSPSGYVNTITAAINLYMMDLDHLIERYKTYKLSKSYIYVDGGCAATCHYSCFLWNSEQRCETIYKTAKYAICHHAALHEAFINVVFKEYGPIVYLKSQFSNIKSNLRLLINQHDSFTLPSAA